MRAVFVIKSLEVAGGGAERVLVDVANGLVARGHEVGVVTFDRADAPTFYPLDTRISRVGIAVGAPGTPTPRIQMLANFRRLRHAILSFAPDVVVGFMHSTYVPMAISMIGAGKSLVASEHVGQQHFRQRPLQRLLVRALDSLFVAKTVPNELQRQELPEAKRRKIEVLANPLDLSAFAGTPSSTTPPAPTLLCVGRFMEEKDHASLLQAFAALTTEFPEWRLRLAGDGVLRPQIEAQVRQLGIEAKVDMPGMIADIADEYRRASIVVVPSRYESFGLTVVEALASSRPVVGFAECLAPLSIAVDGTNALLVDGTRDRAGHLAAALRTLMTDRALRDRLGAAGPSSVLRFDRETVVSDWERFLLRHAKPT